MNRNKNSIRTFALCMAATLLAGCSAGNTTPGGAAATAGTQQDKIKIVTTIFPEYDWVKQILGSQAENADVTMLLDNGVDLHSYQPTADDIIKISDCDLFIYVGGESDGWAEDTLKEAANSKMKVIDLLEVLGSRVKEEEIVEGMEADEEEEGEDEEEQEEALRGSR